MAFDNTRMNTILTSMDNSQLRALAALIDVMQDGGIAQTSGVTLTDASIANAGGASETIAALSTTRNVLIVANPSATVSWWINPSGGTAAGAGGGGSGGASFNGGGTAAGGAGGAGYVVVTEYCDR